ncbi:MAG: GTP 3',8-cyclase MoaA [Thermoprotei archaeon]
MSVLRELHGEEHRELRDGFGRIARKLRISVTDRCNFRCSFCMPSNPVWLKKEEILTYEEITRVVGILAGMGVSKVRLSGGEPLVRKDIEQLVKMIHGVPGVSSVSMTTNGALLRSKAAALKHAGLSSVTVSLHSLKSSRYDRITGTRGVFDRVLDGVAEARRVGIEVKVNCVVTRGCNDDEILDFADFAVRSGTVVRFIEYMPFDGQKPWDSTLLVSGKEVISRIKGRYELVELPREAGSTAVSYTVAGHQRPVVSTITSMTAPFCGDCDRIRLKAEGKIVPCLFSQAEYDIKTALRSGASDRDLELIIRSAFASKFAGVETLIKSGAALRNVRPMHVIGG